MLRDHPRWASGRAFSSQSPGVNPLTLAETKLLAVLSECATGNNLVGLVRASKLWCQNYT